MANLETNADPVPHLSAIAPDFLTYAAVERGFAPQTISKYRDCLRQVGKMIGDLPVTEFGKEQVMGLKAAMLAKNHSCGRQLSILAAFKGLLLFCQSERGLPVFDADMITLPRRPRREVGYLTTSEVETFVAAIDLRNQDDKPFETGVRFRALVEVLLGSAMRISEVLSLNRIDVNFESREAKVIGKGNKQRTVFFTERALWWLSRYLDIRGDTHPALFVTQGGRSRIDRTDVWRPFTRYRKASQIPKRITPHLLRHTAATQLLFNGCPIGHIKEILGHERLETTCRYYLGLDRRAAKQAHQDYLVYDQRGHKDAYSTSQCPLSSHESDYAGARSLGIPCRRPGSTAPSSGCPGDRRALL